MSDFKRNVLSNIHEEFKAQVKEDSCFMIKSLFDQILIISDFANHNLRPEIFELNKESQVYDKAIYNLLKESWLKGNLHVEGKTISFYGHAHHIPMTHISIVDDKIIVNDGFFQLKEHEILDSKEWFDFFEWENVKR